MNIPLNQRFCLKDDRRNFSINFRQNSDDRKAYFGKSGLNTEIIKSIRERYMLGNPPKKYLWGQYGTGKTHTLYHIKYNLEESFEARTYEGYEVRCCPIDTEFRERTTYNYLHSQIMEAVSLEKVRQVVEEYLAAHAGPDLEKRLREDFEDSNAARAIRALAIAGETITLWKWLCGGTLSNSELTSYNLTKNMDTVAELFHVLIGVMRLFVNKQIYYLFLFDEMEGLQNIGNSDCRESFQDAFRKLADDDNNVVGFIASIHAMREEAIPQFIYTDAIKTRLNKANIHELEYLHGADDVRQFLTDLFHLVIDNEKRKSLEENGKIAPQLDSYPFTQEAMDEVVSLATSAPHASVPRNFISTVNECAVLAARRDSYLIDVQDLAPAEAIFSDLI